METVYEIRTARKQHVCSELSYHTIQKGQRYLYGVLPPWHEMSRGKKFETIKACLRCAEEFGMHTADTREQLKQDTVV